ncbi:hypothetical protein HY772_10170 [Candidatus Woesearchaeota archaeon]|nr:hypothetical protein [Candidatus Woesearchaeota archaeon]
MIQTPRQMTQQLRDRLNLEISMKCEYPYRVLIGFDRASGCGVFVTGRAIAPRHYVFEYAFAHCDGAQSQEKPFTNVDELVADSAWFRAVQLKALTSL